MLLFGLFFCAGYIPQCYRHYYKASGKYLKLTVLILSSRQIYYLLEKCLVFVKNSSIKTAA
jgi:hypothetical protein